MLGFALLALSIGATATTPCGCGGLPFDSAHGMSSAVAAHARHESDAHACPHRKQSLAPAGAGWSPFEAIQYVYDGEDWQRDLSSPASNVLSDIADGNLAKVSFVVSPRRECDSPEAYGGPAWVSTIVRAVRKSNYWANAAVLVFWDDEGDGLFYDNAAPPQLDVMGLGFRVPLIPVSRYAKRGYVSHTQYEFGSILKFIEQNWNLPYLGGGATDQRANSIADMFTFTRLRSAQSSFVRARR
jgi:hypothetical protein